MGKIKPGKNASKKDMIIRNASSLFKARGFNAASMRELAETLNVEAPSLYNHIGSKSELLQAICFDIAAAFTTHLDHAESLAGGKTAIIENIIRFHIRMMLDKYDEVFVANHEWKHLKDPDLSNFLNQRRNYEKRLVAIIEQGIASKEIKAINPYVVVQNILSAVRGLEFWHRHKKNVSARVLEDDMVDHLLKGIIIENSRS
jgi:AcrR family transcriptional regulator